MMFSGHQASAGRKSDGRRLGPSGEWQPRRRLTVGTTNPKTVGSSPHSAGDTRGENGYQLTVQWHHRLGRFGGQRILSADSALTH